MSFSDRKIQLILLNIVKTSQVFGGLNGNAVKNSQIEEFIAYLKGRKSYEEKKAIKLVFQILKNM